MGKIAKRHMMAENIPDSKALERFRRSAYHVFEEEKKREKIKEAVKNEF